MRLELSPSGDILPSQHVHRKANSFYQEFVRFNHVASVILNADSRRMSSEALF